MELRNLYTLARDLMSQHGLGGDWSLTVDSSKRRFGVCRYTTKTISLSMPLVKLNSEEQVKNTILHEIAHALVGSGNGHGRRWKAQAQMIGAKAERCYGEEVITPPKKWTATCSNCQRVIKRHRRTKIACRRCCRGRFNTAYMFIWKREK